MFYRVVLQGRTLGDADLTEVKQHFVRVTGLPALMAEQLFGGMPKVIKRQVPQSDAERIAATLRAIGAAATVERELPGEEHESPDEIRVVATPLHTGPPTVIPGTEAPPPQPAPTAARHRRWLRAVREKWPLLVGGTLLVAGAVPLAPVVDDLVDRLQRAPPPAPVAAARVKPSERPQPAPAINASLLQGPWRCTDQNTGVATYWSFDADGALVYYGDVFKEGAAARGSTPSVPTGWKLNDHRLLLTYPQRAPETYAVAELTLSRLRYGNERGLDIQCRRP